MPYITESKFTAFRNALDFIRSMKTSVKQNKAASTTGYMDGKNNGYYYSPGLTKSSIMKAGKDLVMSYPVLCSDTLQPETAAMITKAIERNCVTQLQMIFSASYLRGADGFDILRQWHKNIDDSVGLDDYLSLIDSISYTIDNNGKVKEHELYKKANNSSFAGNVDNFLKAVGEMTQITEAMCKAVKENNQYFPESSFSEHGVNCFEINETYNGFEVRFNPILEVGNNDGVQNPWRGGFGTSKNQADVDAAFFANQQRQREEWDKRQNDINKAAADRTRTRNDRMEKDIDRLYKAQRDEIQDIKDRERALQMNLKDESEFFTRQLMDNDVRKCNELVPSMIIIRFNIAGTDSQYKAGIEQQFIAGVKARLIPCASEEIIDRIRVILSNKVNRLNWVRATTGEISFMKDFVMGIEQAKIDAKRNSTLSRTSPIWRSLQFRANKSTINRLKKNKANDAGAITTLVVNATEVNALRKSYNIDLYNISTINDLMENYNFMGVVIVDEDMEVARFIFDGGTHFEDISFHNLERETGDGSYKKVVNLISKINRG